MTRSLYIICIYCLGMGCSDPAEELLSGEARVADAMTAIPQYEDPNPYEEVESNEPCDGLDNDQDGRVDESGCACMPEAQCYDGPIVTRNVGLCSDGVLVCDGQNEFVVACEGTIRPQDELCDGLDQDCDGQVDEACCDTDPSCESLSEEFRVGEEIVVRPTDFVMVVDNSGSMRDTAAAVRNNLGDFSERLVEAGIDYTFTVISRKGSSGTGVCVRPPMGGPNCQNTPRFRHIEKNVTSTSALSDLTNHYGINGEAGNRAVDEAREYKSILRPDALLQFIAVTDDESHMDWQDFREGHVFLDYPDALFHAVVGLQRGGCVASVGNEYILGAQRTGGAQLSVCDADWGHVLDVILDTTLSFLTASFELLHVPKPGTLKVYQGPDRQPVLEGWDYVEDTQTIEFQPDAIPPADTIIHVEYDRMLE